MTSLVSLISQIPAGYSLIIYKFSSRYYSDEIVIMQTALIKDDSKTNKYLCQVTVPEDDQSGFDQVLHEMLIKFLFGVIK